MSGICGHWSFDDAGPDLEPALTLLERRGPDGTHFWADGPVALGQTLLATTPEALVEVLPLSDRESGCTITADARIDNRDELFAALDLGGETRTVGDGELILRAYLKWADECPTHLLGDFAFAIWDPRSQSIFCARDHMGMRQLIYHHSPTRLFAFATETDALVANPSVPKRVNEARIADFLDDLESIDFTSTFYRQVYRLAPAHVLKVDADGLSISRYWEVAAGPVQEFASNEAYEEAFLKVFFDAVRCRLRGSRLVGSMLSGGLDSNAVAAVAGNILGASGTGPLPVFSAVASDLKNCEETRCIQAAAENEDFLSTKIDHANLEELLPELIELARHDAEPFDGQMTLVRAVYSKASKAGLKSVLDGLSADLVLSAGNGVARFLRSGKMRRAWREAKGRETFWGRPENAKRIMLEAVWATFAPSWMRTLRRKAIYGRNNWALRRGNRFISTEFAKSVKLQSRRAAFFEFDGKRPSLVASDRARLISHPALAAGRERYDRVASALAIEPRDPFLDIRVIAFCLSLPPDQLQFEGWPKFILRRAMKGLVIDQVAWRRGKEHLGLTFNNALAKARGDTTAVRGCRLAKIRRFLSRKTLSELENASKMDIRPYFKLVTLCLWLERVAGSHRSGEYQYETFKSVEAD